MFSVNHDAYIETLAQFSHMFIDLLFSSSGVARELHAVDQEHDKNLVLAITISGPVKLSIFSSGYKAS